MISELITITHATPIGTIFHKNHTCGFFEGDTVVQKVLDFFAVHGADAVIIGENTLPIGIVTHKDMLRIVSDCDRTGLLIKEFCTSPVVMFDSGTSVGDVIDKMEHFVFDKIVIHTKNRVIGIIDRHHLLSLCYSHLTPLIKHEYNMVHSLMGLVGEDDRNLLKMATTDTLTGIGNRRLFEEVFQAHQSLKDRYDVNLFLVLFDIDNFKSINDTFGHGVGDSVLKELARLVSKLIRKSDIFVRWGGEEFAVLLRYTDPMAVMKVADQIRKKIDKNSFETIVHVTCSFGLTSIEPNETLETVFARADRALYRAKGDGKNCVRMEL